MKLSDILGRIAALDGDERMSADDEAALRAAVAANPGFGLGAALLLRYGHVSDDELAHLRERVALTSGDVAAAVSLVDPAGIDAGHFYPACEAPHRPATADAIDTFLEHYGHSSPQEEAMLERLIFNPTPDYSEVLAAESASTPLPAAKAGTKDALIDEFIRKHEQAEATPEPVPCAAPAEAKDAAGRPLQPVTAPEPSDDSLLSESLAKIFIRQGRYERAYEIISNISLQFPKKSVYFADQLRFLQKLIANRRLSGQ